MEPPPSLHSPAALALLSTQATPITRLSSSNMRSCRAVTREGLLVRKSACPWQPIRPWLRPEHGRLRSEWSATQQPQRSHLLEPPGTRHRPSLPGSTECKHGAPCRPPSVPLSGEWTAQLRPLEPFHLPGAYPSPCRGLGPVTTVIRSTRRRAKPAYGAPSPWRDLSARAQVWTV